MNKLYKTMTITALLASSIFLNTSVFACEKEGPNYHEYNTRYGLDFFGGEWVTYTYTITNPCGEIIHYESETVWISKPDPAWGEGL